MDNDKYPIDAIEGLRWIAQQPCTMDCEESSEDTECIETQACCTEWCLPCYAKSVLRGMPVKLPPDPKEQYYAALKEHGKFDITEDDAIIGWCPQCGPMEQCDEDGCCLCCGAGMGEVPNYLNLLKRAESAEAVVREILAWLDSAMSFRSAVTEAVLQGCKDKLLIIARKHGLEVE